MVKENAMNWSEAEIHSTDKSNKQNRMKQTEIGLIPEDWEVQPLSYVFNYISYGFTNPMPTTQSGVWMVTANDIKNGRVNFETARKTSEFAYHKLITDKSRPRKGDLLLTKDGSLGRVAVVSHEKICINQSVAVIRSNDRVNVNFLKHLLQDEYYQKVMIENAGGSTIKHIYITVVDKMLIVVPPLLEQEAISMALSDCDAWIESLEQVIAKKRLIKQGAMQELLTPKEDWEIKKLGDLINLLADYTANGSFESLKNSVKYYSSNNHAVLVRTTDLDKKVFVPERFTDEIGYRFLSKTALFGGELIIANVGSIGKVFRVPKYNMPMTLAPNTYVIKLHSIYSHDYLYQWMKTDEFVNKVMSKVGSSTLMAINKDNLRAIDLKIPSFTEQSRIATVLSDMDTEIEALEQKLNKARQIKQGMMQELLTGRVRLV